MLAFARASLELRWSYGRFKKRHVLTRLKHIFCQNKFDCVDDIKKTFRGSIFWLEYLHLNSCQSIVNTWYIRENVQTVNRTRNNYLCWIRRKLFSKLVMYTLGVRVRFNMYEMLTKEIVFFNFQIHNITNSLLKPNTMFIRCYTFCMKCHSYTHIQCDTNTTSFVNLLGCTCTK